MINPPFQSQNEKAVGKTFFAWIPGIDLLFDKEMDGVR